MFRIEMLPAAHGDALLLTYGNGDVPHRILVDGGVRWTYNHLRSRILEIPCGQRHFELIIVTHIDADHIEGIIRLLQDESLEFTFGEIWFNGQPQLAALPDPAGDQLGPEQGEFLGALIRHHEKKLGHDLWNRSFDGAPITVNADDPLMFGEFGGMKLTVVSPGIDQLIELKDEWDTVIADAGFESGDIEGALAALIERKDLAAPDVLGHEESEADSEPDPDDVVVIPDQLGEGDAAFGSDSTPANGSSIAVIAEFDGKRVLLGGDAHARVLLSGLQKWKTETGQRSVSLDLFKVPHHGSVANVSEELLALVKTRSYLISTSGAIFGHPHKRAIDLLLEAHQHRAQPRLVFNYRTSHNDAWGNPDDQATRKYKAVYPAGTTVDLHDLP